MVKPSFAPSDPESRPESQKRKVTDDDNLDRTEKKPRTRTSFSCRECHRRKQKCNRQIPCSHCIARKVPHLCTAYSPEKSEEDIHARILRIEHILEIALPQYWSPDGSGLHSGDANDPKSTSTALEEEDSYATEEEDLVGGSFQRETWIGNGASGIIASASVLEQLDNAVASNIAPNHDRRAVRVQEYSAHKAASQVSTTVFTETASGPGQERSAVDNFHALIQDCGVSPHKISELIQELPPKFLAKDLIDYYFSAINWTRYPIPEQDFRASYDSLCSSDPSALPNDLRFLPLLFVVLAISVRLSPERLGGDAKTRRLTSLRYYWSSRRSLLIAAAIQPDCLEMIWTRLLSARFLIFDRRITEGWSQLGAAVSTAQALGLHRDVAAMRMTPTSVENRRRIWAYLYHADRSFALILGRPAAIKDEYTSTQVPLNLDYDLSTQPVTNPPPLTVPTPMTFVILRHSLSIITGGIVHHFQQVQRLSHYSDVGRLDDELLEFMGNLPPHYAMEPDTSLDQSHSYIPAHRFLLITEILFIRMTLHRPYLLRRLNSDRYLRSRKACFESALKDFKVRQDFHTAVTKETREAVAIAYREFQAVMISGIYLVLYPRGEDATAMHEISDVFLREHEGEEEVYGTTSREVKTIQFLKSKALQMAENSMDSAISPGSRFDPPASRRLQQPVHRRPGESSPHRSSDADTQSPDLSHDTQPQTSPIFGLRHSPDESAAQSLLDHWYNTVGEGSMTDGTGSMTGLPSAFNSGLDSAGSFFINTVLGDAQTWDGSGGGSSDLSYWETLVDQIRSLPS